MSKFNISRLDFLRGGLSFLGLGALGDKQLFAVTPEIAARIAEKTPRILFGVISDTHLRTTHRSNRLGSHWPDKYLVAALKYFKSQNVDAVMHCGDMAHRGQVREMQFHANAWCKVFGKVTDGPVKLFVTGNHDLDGSDYGDFVKKRYPDEKVRAKHVLKTDMAGHWEKIWGEKYDPVWHKEVKGFHFLGRHWGVNDSTAIAKLKGWSGVIAASGTQKYTQPFFYVQHRRPSRAMRKALIRYPGAFSFFGHNHWSVTNWNLVNLYYSRLPVIQCASCEPRGCAALVGDGWITKAKIQGREQVGRGRFGFVVRVFDDMLTIERREFGKGGSLGANWVMPLGDWKEKGLPHPFSRNELKKVIGEPQFCDDAKLKLEKVILNVSEKNSEVGKSSETAAIKKEDVSEKPLLGLKISIPLANGNPNSRIYAYEVEVNGLKTLLKAVYATGVNLGIGHEPNNGVTELTIPMTELPPGEILKLVVRPLSSLGTSGKSLMTTFRPHVVLSDLKENNNES